MICPSCGTTNEKGFKFCVKCGNNLENPQEVNYEQVDMGGYHTEEEFDSASKGFTVGNGTFTINDRATGSSASDIYTADELNDSDEEFDFSMYDEPFIPRLDSDRLSLPKAGSEPMQVQPQGFPQQPMMGGMPNQSAVGGMPQQGFPQQPQMMYGQPQIIGYDQNGMPIYSQPQPVMYAQPQIVGYDQNGMPVYAQAPPIIYGQPQIVGYDQNGMPIYGQPQQMMYGQPQIIGYDPNGMPIYAQGAPVPMPEMQSGMQSTPSQGMPGMPSAAPQGMPGMPSAAPQGMPGMPSAAPQGMPGMQPLPQQGAGNMYGMPSMPKAQPKQESKELVDVSEDFWKFFDGGSATKHKESNPEDFFGKSRGGMGDLGGSRQNDKKKTDYMNDTPIVDANKLAHNDTDKFNKFYMRQTESVNAEDLAANTHTRVQDHMGVTKQVDAGMLSDNLTVKSRVTMYAAGEVDADSLEAYVPEHKEALMGQADHAVEALPKRQNPYESELDKIELPEYMQAKKTVREETINIPSLPQV